MEIAPRLASWMRSHPVVAFYLLAFCISWVGWIPRAAYSHGLFPFDSPVFSVIGGTGPLIAAYLVLRMRNGSAAIRILFAPLLRWRTGMGWYVVALAGYPAIWIVAVALSGDLDRGLRALGSLPALLPTFVALVIMAIPEELAWRGYALPRLQARHSALVASLVVGALWALWHLPLLATRGSAMADYPLIAYLVSVMALAVVYTWIFNTTAGSGLLVVLFHAASNSVGPFVGVEQTVISLLVAGVIVARFGSARLSTRGVVVVPRACGRRGMVGERVTADREWSHHTQTHG